MIYKNINDGKKDTQGRYFYNFLEGLLNNI